MKKKGSFYTSTLEEEGYTFVSLHDGELIVADADGNRDQFQQADDFAGWTLEFDNHQYEFACSIR